MSKYTYNKKEYTEEELIEIAKHRIKIKRELYAHIVSYFLVNAFLLFIYGLFNDFDYYIYNAGTWYIWVLTGWGLGLLFHIFESIQELNFKFNANAINKELEKLKNNK